MFNFFRRHIRSLFVDRESAENMANALHKIATAPVPFNEHEYQVFVSLAIEIAGEALCDFEKYCQGN